MNFKMLIGTSLELINKYDDHFAKDNTYLEAMVLINLLNFYSPVAKSPLLKKKKKKLLTKEDCKIALDLYLHAVSKVMKIGRLSSPS